MALTREALGRHLTSLFSAYAYEDYGPNGLQIEGKDRIARVAFAVSATQESIQKSCEWGADALIVHHGLYWRFHGPRTLTGPHGARVLALARANVNLFAYHLPLDGHPEFGNAPGLARRLGLEDLTPFGIMKGAPIGVQGRFPSPIGPDEFRGRLEKLTGRAALCSVPEGVKGLQSVGIITGGAPTEWPQAQTAGLDAYVTGEMSEHHWHDAREAGLCMFAGGHHATERYGVQDLMERLKKDFPGLETRFFDSLNPA